jgi:Uncharacterized conserved protein
MKRFIMKNSSIVFLGLMLLFLAVPNAAAATENNASKLTVQGDGKVTASPDMATIVLGVETQNASAAGAVRENAGLMNKTINALKAAGIRENNIQTSSFSLTTMPQDQPKMANEKPKAPVFLATNQVTVKLNNTTDVSRVLDAAVSAGSNSIQQVSFDLRDPRPQNDKAMTLAIEDARRQAEVAAKAAGVKLGRVLEITEGYGYTGPTAKSALFADIATPIQPGQLEVSASVTLIYEIS